MGQRRIAAIAVGALAVRLFGLQSHSLWFDEALEYGRAASGLVPALFGRPIDQDPPLLALWLVVWLQLGRSEWWLRVPSALLGALSVYLIGAWSARRFGARLGLVAAGLTALAPLWIHYSQELNQYSAVLFWSILLVIGADGVLRRGRSRDWLLYTAATVASLFTHYGMAFPVAAQLAHVAKRLLARPERWELRRLGLYLALVVGCLVALLATGLADRLLVPHLQRRFGGTYTGKELAYLADMLWREVLVFFLLPFSGGPALWAVRLLTALALTGAAALWRSGDSGFRLVAVGFGLTLALVYPADGFGLYPIGHRYVLFAAPPFFLALAAGFDRLIARRRHVGWAVLGATLALFIAFAPQQPWSNPWLSVPREELKTVLAALHAARHEGDLVYVYHAAEPAFRYYEPEPSMPVRVGRAIPDATTAQREAERIAAWARGHAIWLVFAHERPGEREALENALARQDYIAAESYAAANARAVRVVRP